MRKLIALFVALLVSPMALAAPTAPLTRDASIDQILSALHARGEGLRDFTAEVSLAEIDALNGDTTTLLGTVWFKTPAEGQGRLRTLFDSKKIGDRIDKSFRVEYLLDNGWLIERDYKRKDQIDRQVLKPGQKMNLLKLGEGPFPLPIGQPPAEVNRLFEVKKVEAKADDPQETVHIQLTPRPNTQFARKFKTIDVWVDLRTHFPTKIDTMDARETGIRSTELKNIQVNTNLDDKHFVLDKVGEDWRRQSESMPEE